MTKSLCTYVHMFLHGTLFGLCLKCALVLWFWLQPSAFRVPTLQRRTHSYAFMWQLIQQNDKKIITFKTTKLFSGCGRMDGNIMRLYDAAKPHIKGI